VHLLFDLSANGIYIIVHLLFDLSANGIYIIVHLLFDLLANEICVSSIAPHMFDKLVI